MSVNQPTNASLYEHATYAPHIFVHWLSWALTLLQQCFPQFERDILLQAFKSETTWAPHLLCAFQTPTHLNLVMDYAEGGSLWDVLESSPHSGKLLEDDLQWWIPQVVSAIHWCHSQGFAHRYVPIMLYYCHLRVHFGSTSATSNHKILSSQEMLISSSLTSVLLHPYYQQVRMDVNSSRNVTVSFHVALATTSPLRS